MMGHPYCAACRHSHRIFEKQLTNKQTAFIFLGLLCALSTGLWLMFKAGESESVTLCITGGLVTTTAPFALLFNWRNIFQIADISVDDSGNLHCHTPEPGFHEQLTPVIIDETVIERSFPALRIQLWLGGKVVCAPTSSTWVVWRKKDVLYIEDTAGDKVSVGIHPSNKDELAKMLLKMKGAINWEDGADQHPKPSIPIKQDAVN